LTKILLRVSIANFLLLGLYTVLNYFEWSKVLELPLVAEVNWTPLRTHIAHVSGTIPGLKNAVLLIDNWSFVVLLGIIAVNLATIWKIEHKNT